MGSCMLQKLGRPQKNARPRHFFCTFNRFRRLAGFDARRITNASRRSAVILAPDSVTLPANTVPSSRTTSHGMRSALVGICCDRK